MSIAEKLTTIAQNQEKVFEAGKKSEYDKFWDTFQVNGNRKFYPCAFCWGWNFDNFYPKYDINVVGDGTRLCYAWASAAQTPSIGSLKQRLEECGVKLDTSKATVLTYAFAYCAFTELPTIDLTALVSIPTNIFSYNYQHLKTIEKIIVNESTPLSTNMFTDDTKLENITFEGVIGGNLNFQWSKVLSKESIENIIGCLSGTVTEKTLTLSQTAVNNAFTVDEWNTLIEGKTNWTISLV